MPAMKFETCELGGVVICRADVRRDSRGFFREISRRDAYAEAGAGMDILQVNTSRSAPGVLRGLHYQIHYPQTKLVACVSGAIYDVVVDCRRDSATFGKWFGIELSADNGVEIYVPAGFAHGFKVLGDSPATVVYQVDDYYHPGDEGGFKWDAPELGISWPGGEPVLAERDAKLPAFTRGLDFPVAR